MKQREITTLKLIESLERDPKQTQRDLARELNISLGLVNAFLKRLINKGYFKIKTIPKNRIKYILTPKGMYEKTRLTYQYISYSLEFYKDTRSKIKSIYDRLAEQGKKRIFIIGANELAEIALITLQESNLKLAGIIDSERAGGKFMGTLIMDFSTIKAAFRDDIAIVTGTNSNSKSIDLIQTNFSKDSIINLCHIKWVRLF